MKAENFVVKYYDRFFILTGEKEGELMAKKAWLLALVLGLLLLLGSCGMASGDELYSLPKLSSDNYHLQTVIDKIRAQGGEYSAPVNGTNVQSIQMHDLDGDGVQEAVAFFRFSNDEKPLKVYVFKKLDNEEYEQIALIEGEGNAFNSVRYENITGSVQKEIVLTWQLVTASTSRLNNLTVHALGRDGATELMRTIYTNYQILDMDRDGLSELAVIHFDSTGENSRTELYRAEKESLHLAASAPLSHGITGLVQVRVGYLQEYSPAVFVYASLEGGGYLTDVFAWQEGQLNNITCDAETGISLSTIVQTDLLRMTDINGDGVLELPFPFELPKKLATEGETERPTFCGIHWRQLDREGNLYGVMTTFHNLVDDRYEWYLEMPEAWVGTVALEREDSTINTRTVIFSLYTDEESEPIPFLRIYRFTGSNRQNRATINNRFKLLETPTVIYAAEFFESSWNCGMNAESLRAAFHLILEEWQ